MRLYKRLKRRYRLKRLLFPLFGIGVLALFLWMWMNEEPVSLDDLPVYQPTSQSGEHAVEDASSLQEEVPYTVTKHSIYVCGEETSDLGTWTGREIMDWLQESPGREWEWQEHQHVKLTEHVLDLAPACKGEVYFGLDTEGNLSLFEGAPGSNNKVLQTFFQIDIEYLESSLPQQTVNSLYEGIRIHDYEEYNSVLSTFAGFAVESRSD